MHRSLIFSALFLLLANARQSLAHPGHGNEEFANTPAHYLLDPFHAVWTIGMLAVLVLLSRPGRSLVAARVRSWRDHQR